LRWIAVRATDARFRWLADSLSQLVWAVDGSGRLAYGNSAWYASAAIAEGCPFVEHYLQIIHPGDRFLWKNTWLQALAAGKPYALERRVRFAPESDYVRQLEWGSPIADGSGRPGEWIIVATDIDVSNGAELSALRAFNVLPRTSRRR
jgi:PAS domain-containing protein